MQPSLRTLAMTGLCVIAGTSSMGVASARACDHGPFGPPAPWAYRAGFAPPFGGPEMAGICPICLPGPPAFAPPPWSGGVHVVRVTRRYVPAGYIRVASYSAYSTPQAYPAGQAYEAPRDFQAPYPSAQGVTFDRGPDFGPGPGLASPMKSAPAAYAVPRAPGYPPDAYATPQEVGFRYAEPPAPSPYPGPGIAPGYPGKPMPDPAMSAPQAYAVPQAPAADLGAYEGRWPSAAPLGPDSVPPPPVSLRPGRPGWPQG